MLSAFGGRLFCGFLEPKDHVSMGFVCKLLYQEYSVSFENPRTLCKICILIIRT